MLSLRSPVVKQGAQTELQKAQADIKRARADVAAAQARAEQANANLAKSRRDARVRLRVTAVIMMTAALIRMGWEAAHEPPPTVAPSLIQPLTSTGTAKNTATATGAEMALDRLRNAFHAFPDEDQPEIVREVNARYAGSAFTCPIAWKDGIPALSVKDKGQAEPMMAGALNQCAAGVERLRKEQELAAAN